MKNEYVQARLAGIMTVLKGIHQSGVGMSSATKGQEREAFTRDFLSEVLPPPFRFGTGEITDQSGALSGQVDVVVEYPALPSLPPSSAQGPRLYLAEGVAAVIEVKSDIAAQWDQVLAKADKVAALNRKIKTALRVGGNPGPKIPFFAVGYVGWKTSRVLKKHLAEGLVDGLLVLDPGLFASVDKFRSITASSDWCLWGLISCLHQATRDVVVSVTDPLVYAVTRGRWEEDGSQLAS